MGKADRCKGVARGRPVYPDGTLDVDEDESITGPGGGGGARCIRHTHG